LNFKTDNTPGSCYAVALYNRPTESYTQVCIKKHKNLVDTFFYYL